MSSLYFLEYNKIDLIASPLHLNPIKFGILTLNALTKTPIQLFKLSSNFGCKS